jgi:hypothetical protein
MSLGVFLGFVCSSLAAPSLTETLGGGSIDWTAQTLLLSGEGEHSGVSATLEQLEASARARVGPRMLGLVRDVRVTSADTAGDLLDRRDALADLVDKNTSLWEATEVRYLTSGQVQIDATLPMHAWLRPALASLAKGRERVIPATSPVTGVVVDARALRVKPCVAPRILGPGEEELYSLARIAAPALGKWSPAAWVADPADVRAVKRGGDAPLFVTAIDVQDGCDLVLGEADAAALKQAAEGAPVLVNAHVAIVATP